MKKYKSLKERLTHVCEDGYVFYNGRWYRGESQNPKDYVCSLCDFASCEITNR